MTGVSHTSRSEPARSLSQPRPIARPQPQPADVKAMQDAMARATRDDRFGKSGLKDGAGLKGGTALKDGAASKGEGKGAPAHGPMAGAEFADARQAQSAAMDQAGERAAERREQQDQLQAGLALPGQANAPAPLPMAAMPSPQVDPSAFAQMLADLWTRENGKGAKEVEVHFGDRAWPTTGARLVRNAAGMLDIALLVQGGATPGERLTELESALTRHGVALGSLAVENAAG